MRNKLTLKTQAYRAAKHAARNARYKAICEALGTKPFPGLAAQWNYWSACDQEDFKREEYNTK